MAITADYNDLVNPNPEEGAYGIYNNFFVKVNSTDVAFDNTYFRFKITELNTNTFYEFNIEPTSDVIKTAWLNPILSLRKRYFDTMIADVISNNVNPKGYQKIRIEIGQGYSPALNEPPVFQGYTLSDDFYFYNGYEPQGGKYRESNYRASNLFGSIQVKLPSVNKNPMILLEDYTPLQVTEKLTVCCWAEVYGAFGGQPLAVWNAESAIISGIAADGTQLTFTVSPFPASLLNKIGLLTYDFSAAIQSTFDSNPLIKSVRCGFYYDEGLGVATELVEVTQNTCDNRYEPIRLRWSNNYGGDEWLTFTKKSKVDLNVTAGKRVLSSGLDYEATDFADFNNTTVPQRSEFGRKVNTTVTLNTGWLDQNQVSALKTLFESPYVLMYYTYVEDIDFQQSQLVEQIVPVITLDRTYQVLKTKDEKVQVSVRLQIANVEPIHIN